MSTFLQNFVYIIEKSVFAKSLKLKGVGMKFLKMRKVSEFVHFTLF